MQETSLERLLDDLALRVEPFAVCEVSRGWRLRLDALEWVTLHFVLEGSGRLRTSGRSRPELKPYTLAVVPPGAQHSIESGDRPHSEAFAGGPGQTGRGPRLFTAGPVTDRGLRIACGRVEVTYGGGPGLFDLLREPLVLDFSGSKRMCSIFEHLLEEERCPSPGGRAMTAALMNECLVLVFRRLVADGEADLPWLSALRDPHLAPVLAAVLESPEGPHSLESLAARALMSRSTFTSQFATQFGSTPMQFVRDVRLRRGAELLRSTRLPIEAVARRVGYSSRSHFSSAFRDRYAESPARFRQTAGVG